MSAKFTLEGSSAGAVKAIQDVAAEVDKLGQKAEGSAKSTRQLNAEAQRIKEALDPQEKLNRKYQELQQHVDAGRISISQATAAGIKYRQELHAASEEGKRAAAAAVEAANAQAAAAKAAEVQAKKRADNERRSLQIVLEAGQRLVAAEEKAKKNRDAAIAQREKELQQLTEAGQKVRQWLDPQERLNAKYRELGVLVKAGALSMQEATAAGVKYRQEIMGVAEEQEKSFGSKAVSDVAAMAAQYASVAAAVGLIVSGLKEKAAEEERAAQRIQQSRTGLSSLSQLAAGEPTKAAADAKFASLVAEARGMYAAGAAQTEGEAGALLFEMVSADLAPSDRAFATQLRAKGTLQNIGGAAGGFDALKTELGSGEVGSFREFMSKSLSAAKLAPGSFEELPVAAALSGGSAKELGISDEFLLAATAIVGKARNSTSMGGTQVAAFLKQAEAVKGSKGIGGVALVEMIAGMSEKDQGYGGVLGDRSEAIQGFRVLRDNLPALRELEASVTKAQASDLAGMAVGLPDTDDQINAANAEFVAERRRELAGNQTLGPSRSLTNAIREDRQAMLLRERRTVDAALDRTFTPIFDHVPGFNSLEQSASQNKSFLSDETRELMRRQTEALERLDQRTGAKVTTRQE